MIEVSKLTKTFDGFEALKEASLKIDKGTIYGLVGPNGAGKTTLLKSITGIYRTDGGHIYIDGMDAYENPDAKEKFVFIPDDLFFFVQANVNDMKKFYKGIYKSFDEERFERLAEVFSGIDRKRTIRKLSKGMQKQVAFWLAISCRPEILILDEPVDGLDPVMRRQVWSLLLADVEEHHTTVLISSHNLRELEDVCDHVGIMSKGKVVLERALSDLQGNVTKLQVVFNGERPELESEFEILHETVTGKIHTLIVKGEPAMVEAKVTNCFVPLFAEALPLTLEEIFIYEMGGEDYAVKEILL